MVDSPRSDLGWERGSEATEPLGPAAPSSPEDSSEESRRTTSYQGIQLGRLEATVAQQQRQLSLQQAELQELRLRVEQLERALRRCSAALAGIQ